MKNLIILTIAMISIISCSNYSGNRKAELSRFEFPSWETEMTKNYVLMRPLYMESGSTDAYGILLSFDQWYFFRAGSDGHLLPVTVRYGNDPSFIEKMVEHQKKAVLDTLNLREPSNAKLFSGLPGVKEVEILCLKEGHIIPGEGTHGEKYPTIFLETTEEF